VNGVGINGIARMLAPSGAGRSSGIGLVYNRIFRLERTLLNFEREQSRRWREAIGARGEPVWCHIAHDDVLLTVNWEDCFGDVYDRSTSSETVSAYILIHDVALALA
jgi:hypothetical protein